MTTFMAKLLQKLTELSCKLANQFIQESNDALMAARTPEGRLTQDVELMRAYEFSDADNLRFESNTQLITDESLDIAALVAQLQALAKKHNSSINLMAEQSRQAVVWRVRAA